MKLGYLGAGLAVASLASAAPLSAQAATAPNSTPVLSGSIEPQAEVIDEGSELRRRGLIFGLVGIGLIVLLLLLLSGDSGAQPQPGPPISP